jgi:hypothetical protein
MGFATRTWTGASVPRTGELRTTAPVEGGWSWRLPWTGFRTALATGVFGGGGTGGFRTQGRAARATAGWRTGAGAGRLTGGAGRTVRFVTPGLPENFIVARVHVEVGVTRGAWGVASAIQGAEAKPISRQTESGRVSTTPA